jgi:hypothetical protein
MAGRWEIPKKYPEQFRGKIRAIIDLHGGFPASPCYQRVVEQ